MTLADQINQQLLDLAACLCNQIDERGLPEVCFCGVVPGDVIAVEYVGSCRGSKDGMAYVRLHLVYPMTRVGVPSEQLNNCGAGYGVEAEVGIIRSAPKWGKNGEPPKPEANLAGSVALVDDMNAIYAAIHCCFSDSGVDYIAQAWKPAILGGALGGSAVVLWGAP